MKKAVILVGMLAISMALFAQSIVVYVHDYPPYYNSEGKGFVSNIISEAFKIGGVDAAIRVMPVKRAVQELIDGKADAFSPGHVFVPEESQGQILWQEYFVVTVCLFYQGQTISSLDDLKGKDVGLVANSPFTQLCLSKGIRATEGETAEQLMKMYVAGRFSAVECTLPSGLLLVHKLMPKSENSIKYFTLANLHCSLAVPKQKAALLDAFRTGIKKLVADGSYIKYWEQIYGKGNVPSYELLPEFKLKGAKDVNLSEFFAAKRDPTGVIIP